MTKNRIGLRAPIPRGRRTPWPRRRPRSTPTSSCCWHRQSAVQTALDESEKPDWRDLQPTAALDHLLADYLARPLTLPLRGPASGSSPSVVSDGRPGGNTTVSAWKALAASPTIARMKSPWTMPAATPGGGLIIEWRVLPDPAKSLGRIFIPLQPCSIAAGAAATGLCPT